MPIREIAVSNFKSFRELEFSPDNFNIIIGSNASGKSNLIQIFKFIRDIAKYGLNNAISLQGGVEYLRNTIIGPDKPFTFRIVYVLEEKRGDVIGAKDDLPISFEPFPAIFTGLVRRGWISLGQGPSLSHGLKGSWGTMCPLLNAST
jgi:AAA ATPase domain